jgi:hypothetical protein
MKNLLLASTLSGVLALPGIASAQSAAAPEHSLSGNATLVSDYRFRGISQTHLLPAVQAGFDYAHKSGFYLGTWGSNVSGNFYPNGAGLEIDVYGGYKGSITGDLGFDVGLLQYLYPGAHANNPQRTKPSNTELYAALSYKWFSAKYSYTLSDFFGANNDTFGSACQDGRTGNAADCFGPSPGGSRGSGYLDLSANFEIASKTTLGLHLGHQSVRNYGKLDYTDYKIGITRDVDGWLLGAALIGTDAKKGWYTSSEAGSPTDYKVLTKPTLVLSLGKTF